MHGRFIRKADIPSKRIQKIPDHWSWGFGDLASQKKEGSAEHNHYSVLVRAFLEYVV